MDVSVAIYRVHYATSSTKFRENIHCGGQDWDPYGIDKQRNPLSSFGHGVSDVGVHK